MISDRLETPPFNVIVAGSPRTGKSMWIRRVAGLYMTYNYTASELNSHIVDVRTNVGDLRIALWEVSAVEDLAEIRAEALIIFVNTRDLESVRFADKVLKQHYGLPAVICQSFSDVPYDVVGRRWRRVGRLAGRLSLMRVSAVGDVSPTTPLRCIIRKLLFSNCVNIVNIQLISARYSLRGKLGQ